MEQYQLIAYIVSILSISSFLTFIIIRYGIQESISASYYSLKKDKKVKGLIFTLSLWIFGIATSIAASVPLIVIAVMGIVAVGSAAAFRESEMTLRTHMIGAFSSTGFAFLGIIVHFNQWELVVLALIGGAIGLLKKDKETKKITYVKNYVWWSEKIVMATSLIGIGFGKYGIQLWDLIKEIPIPYII